MLVCISIHAGTDTLCFRPKILKRVNSSELVFRKLLIWPKGDKCYRNIKRTGLIRLHYIPSVVFVVSEANKPLATCKVLGYLTQI